MKIQGKRRGGRGRDATRGTAGCAVRGGVRGVVWTAAAALLLGAVGAEPARSNRANVCLDTRGTPFWHTIQDPSASGSVDLDWPVGAARATLTVAWSESSPQTFDLTDTTATSFPLPGRAAPATAAAERVCELTLAYDSGVTRRTTLGLVRGVGQRSRVPLIFSREDRSWTKVSRPCVLPVPAGTTSLTANGAALPVDALAGDAGWVAWKPALGANALARVDVDGTTDDWALDCSSEGTAVLVR